MISTIILAVGLGLVLQAINKKSKITVFLLLLYMFVIFTLCNGGNPDLAAYQWRYTDKIYTKSFVFDFFIWLFRSIGLNFIIFKAFIGVFVISVLYYTIKKTTPYTAVALGLFVIFPFMSTIAQLRNGMMMVVVLNAIVNLIENPNKKITYIIKIAFASFIHPVALFYLVFLFSKVDYRKKKNMRILALVFVGIVFILICIYNNLLYNFVSVFIKNQKYLVYFDYSRLLKETTSEVLNWKGKLLPMIGQTIGYLSFRSIYIDFRKKLITNGDNNIIKPKNRIRYFNIYQLDMINNMLLLMFLISPFYMLNPTYFRLFKNVALLIYIVDAQYLYYTFIKRLRTRRVIERHLFVMFNALLAQIMTVYSQGYFFEMLESFSFFL